MSLLLIVVAVLAVAVAAVLVWLVYELATAPMDTELWPEHEEERDE